MAWREFSDKTVVCLLNSRLFFRPQGDIDEETKAPYDGGKCGVMPIYFLLYVNFVGSGMYSLRAHILSRSLRKEFEKSCVRGTECETSLDFALFLCNLPW